MIKELREIKKEYNFGDALNIGLFMEEVIKTFVEFEKHFKKVEKLADDNWRSLEYIMGFYEEHSKRFATDSVDTYNGKPISEIKVGGTD